MKIYHNPRCRKSRETLQLIESKKISPEIVLYLEDPLTKKELKKILAQLKISAKDLIRKIEPIFKEEYKDKEFTEAQWIDAMIKYPKLMERPIVVHENKAKIGRPPENVLELLS